MYRRRRNLAVLFTSAAAATFGVNRFIQRRRTDASNESDAHLDTPDELSLKLLEKRLHLTDDLLKNKDNLPYILSESVDVAANARYQLALHFIKQAHSNNTHIRDRGLSRLARLGDLPPIYYTIIGQQLDYRSSVQLARTHEANTNLFPTGPPYIFSVSDQKILTTDNVNKVNDDSVLLYTIRQFLKTLIDEENHPLDILSQHYLKLVSRSEFHQDESHRTFLSSSSILIWMK